MFYNETNSTEATRSIRNRLRNSRYVSMAHSYSDDQLLTLQAIILGQSEIQKRQAVEQFIMRRVVTVLVDAGYLLTVHNGDALTVKQSKDANEIMCVLMDDGWYRLTTYPIDHDSLVGWVHFVCGYGSGWGVMYDYSTSLEDVLRPVRDLIREIGP